MPGRWGVCRVAGAYAGSLGRMPGRWGVPPYEEPAAFELARQIEVTYPGYEPIPRAFGNEVVSLGKTTIYEWLFSPTWEGSC